VAEDLDLVVDAAAVGHRSVADRPAHPVAGAVEGLVAPRRHDEGGRRLLRILPVAERDLRAGEQQLAVLPGRDLAKVLADHDRRHARVGRADRHDAEGRLGR
jgi:hypothetical protein